MQHYDESELRRSLDEPLEVDPALEAHVASCAHCAAAREALAGDARVAGAALGGEIPSTAERPFPMRVRRRNPWIAGGAALAAAAALVLGLLYTPLGGVAASFLTIFEPQQFQAIPVTAEDREQLRLMPHLESFGTFARPAQAPIRRVASLDEARALTGFTPRSIASPPPGELRVYVAPRYTWAFTFSAVKARAYESRYKRTLPAMPPGLDGTTVHVTIGPVLIRGYGTGTPKAGRGDSLDKGVIFVEMPAPRVTSTGASEAVLAAYLLSLPNVPPDLAAELKGIGDPSHTLPIPLPIDKQTASDVAVDGVRGLAIGDQTGLGSGVMWEKDGMVYSIAGAAKESEILALANGFR